MLRVPPKMKKSLFVLVVTLGLCFAYAPTTSFAADGGAAPVAAAPTAPAAAPAAVPAPAPTSQPAKAAAPAEAAAPVAPAPEPAAPLGQSWWMVLLAELLKAFTAIFVPVISFFVVTLLRRWKIKLEHEQVEKIAVSAAGWAEQKALVALKDGGKQTAGGEKMKMALDFANGLASQYKLKSKATTQLEALIESGLGAKKLDAEKKPA